MNQILRFHIISFCWFILSLNAYANSSCKDLREELLNKPSNILIRRYLEGKNKIETVAVNQCRGSCYFESTISHLESLLSEHIGEITQLPRLPLLRKLYKKRIGKRFVGAFFDKNLNLNAHMGDLLSSGSSRDVQEIINEAELQVLGRKSQALVHRENRLIEKINQTMESELSKYWRFNKNNFARLHRDLKRDTIEHLLNILKNLQGVTDEKSIELIKKVSAIYRINSYIEKLLNVSDEDMYTQKLTILIREVLVTLDMLQINFLGDHNLQNFISSRRVIEKSQEFLMFEKKFAQVSEQIIDDVFNIHQREIEQLNYQFKGKVRLGEAREARIQINDFTSGPILMAHTYPRNIRSAQPGDQGILYRKESTINKGALHLVNIVDFIRNEDGEIEFYVIKNSWGTGNSYRGYDFLHKSLFSESVGMKRLIIDQIYFYQDMPKLDFDFDF